MHHEAKLAVRLVGSEQTTPASVLRSSCCKHDVQNGKRRARADPTGLAFVF